MRVGFIITKPLGAMDPRHLPCWYPRRCRLFQVYPIMLKLPAVSPDVLQTETRNLELYNIVYQILSFLAPMSIFNFSGLKIEKSIL